jgi:hypothetical protein
MPSIYVCRELQQQKMPISFTNAPLPRLASLYPSEKRMYGSVQRVENLFAGEGNEIPDNYVDKLQAFLANVTQRLAVIQHPDHIEPDSFLSCDVLFIKNLARVQDGILVDEIIQRPCSWGLAFFNLLIWQLMRSGASARVDLCFLNPSERVRRDLIHICGLHSFTAENDGAVSMMILSVANMQRLLNSGQFGPEKIGRLAHGSATVLNRAGLPRARDLNSQAWLDRHYVPRARDT